MKRSFVCQDLKEAPRVGLVRCWKCPNCRALRLWLRSLRVHLEAYGHDDRVWLATLTFKEPHTDEQGYPLVQKWLKRVRKALPAGAVLRYTCVCELGSRNRRLHYHLVVYANDLVKYRSLTCWDHGFSQFKLVSGREATRYVLKYMGKGHGKVRSSVRLGADFMDRVHSCVSDVLAQFPGAVVSRVGPCKVPREYFRVSEGPGPAPAVPSYWREAYQFPSDTVCSTGMSRATFRKLYRLQQRSRSYEPPPVDPLVAEDD